VLKTSTQLINKIRGLRSFIQLAVQALRKHKYVLQGLLPRFVSQKMEICVCRFGHATCVSTLKIDSKAVTVYASVIFLSNEQHEKCN
jgi:hypothetical protein